MLNEKPEHYLRVIASLVPKEIKISADPLEDASDDELVGMLDMIRTMAKSKQKTGKPNDLPTERTGKKQPADFCHSTKGAAEFSEALKAATLERA